MLPTLPIFKISLISIVISFIPEYVPEYENFLDPNIDKTIYLMMIVSLIVLTIDLTALAISTFIITLIFIKNFFTLEENKQLTIFKKGEKIGDLYFESLSMHIIYKYRKGFLSKVINLGEKEEENIKKFSLTAMKKAMLVTSITKTGEYKEQSDSGLSVMDFFLKNRELLNRVILNGSFYESHNNFRILLIDDFYIESVIKLYDKQHPYKKNVSKSRKLSWFTPEIALEYKLPVFTDEQANNLISNNIDTSELVNNGLLHKFYRNGFELIYFIIEPIKVSGNNEYNNSSTTNATPSSSSNTSKR